MNRLVKCCDFATLNDSRSTSLLALYALACCRTKPYIVFCQCNNVCGCETLWAEEIALSPRLDLAYSRVYLQRKAFCTKKRERMCMHMCMRFAICLCARIVFRREFYAFAVRGLIANTKLCNCFWNSCTDTIIINSVMILYCSTYLLISRHSKQSFLLPSNLNITQNALELQSE